jgi:hypothetical protein
VSRVPPESEKVTITADDRGLLPWCAVSYDRRLRNDHVPALMWEMLPQEWRGKINGCGADPRWDYQPAAYRISPAPARRSEVTYSPPAQVQHRDELGGAL